MADVTSMHTESADEKRPVPMETNKVVLRHRKPRGGRDSNLQNGLSRPKSEFFSPSGISTLDIRTRLRITEAELALVQREVSDLLTERNSLETSSRQYEDSWRFAVKECGRIVEQRNELQEKLESLQQLIASNSPHAHEFKAKAKVRSTKSTLEQLKLQLETQTRVAESIEHERDRAYDDYVMAQAQIHTLMRQYQDLASACSEVARERNKARAEVQLLREELHRYEPEENASTHNSLRKVDSLVGGSHGSLSSLGVGGGGNGEESGHTLLSDPNLLLQHVKEMKQERDKANSRSEQAVKRAEQCQKQLYRAEDDRRQALATSEALTALWQKKFEKAQNENYDLRQELLSAQDRISLIQDKYAMVRIQSREVTPSRPSPPNYQSEEHGGRHSPARLCVGYPRSYTGGNYSYSQSAASVTPNPAHHPQPFLSQSNTAPNIFGLTRTESLSSSHNTPPSSVFQKNVYPWKQHVYYEDTFEGSHSTDDESSWI